MRRRAMWFSISVLLTFASPVVSAQNPQPYSLAATDRLIHPKTRMVPPPRNMPFVDPDFGSLMVRATDETTNFKLPGTFLATEGSGQANVWSIDSSKFYTMGEGGQVLAFAFTPSTMAISSLPNASPGQALLLPLRNGTFSTIDPNLIYGTTDRTPLTITAYYFATGESTRVIDTRTCGTQPALGTGPDVRSDDDVSISAGDRRISISEGGAQFSKHMFVIVYDKKLGCRWYNTQTGEMGGKWGAKGTANVATRYLVRHAYISRNGKCVRILTNWLGWFVWDVATLNVEHCGSRSRLSCGGYGVVGYDSLINGTGRIDDMQVLKRPLSNITQITQLVWPIPLPHYWGLQQHFSWSNVDAKDSVPVCGSTYLYDANGTITQPYEGEIFCVETDGAASVVWRFAHNRATYVEPYFNTQPVGNVSQDGQFFIWTSDWDMQLGIQENGTPRSDVWIVRLE
jgi:hypothetical protein